MPIINSRSKTERNDNATKAQPGSDGFTADTSKAPDEQANAGAQATQSKAPPPKTKKKPLTLVTIAVLLLCTAGGVYYSAKSAKLEEPTSYSSSELDPAEVVLEIDRFAKLGGMISLTKQEIEVNTITLIEAEESGSSVTMNAIEIIINKKKQELKELQDKAVATLGTLYNFSLQNQEQTEAIFTEQIKQAEKEEKASRAKILQIALDAVNSVQPIGSPEQHFRGMIEDRM